jgi:hypothetical protein
MKAPAPIRNKEFTCGTLTLRKNNYALICTYIKVLYLCNP